MASSSLCRRFAPAARSRASASLPVLLGALWLVTCPSTSLAQDHERTLCVAPASPSEKAREGCITADQLPDALADLARGGLQGVRQVTVTFASGTHRLSGPIRITSGQWRPGSPRLVLQGQSDGSSLLVGSRPVEFRAPTAQETRALGPHKALADRLLKADFAARRPLSDLRFGGRWTPSVDVVHEGRRLPVARTPDEGYAQLDKVQGSGRELHVSIKGLRPDTFASGPGAARMGGFFFHDWAEERLEVKPDGTGQAFRFAQNAPQYGARRGARVWMENTLADVSRPGEWFYDPDRKELWILPPAKAASAVFEVAQADAAIELNGVSNVQIRRLRIAQFLDAAVKVEDGMDITLDGIDARLVGGDAFRLQGSEIEAHALVVKHSGGGGVILNGGDRKLLAPARLKLKNCSIESVGELQSTYKPAVSILGVGNTVEGCTLRHGPHAAVIFHGNDHVVRGNRIEDFGTATDDVGWIYTGQDWTARGTVVSGNVLVAEQQRRRVGPYGVVGIYLDDQASGTEVRGNVIEGLPVAIKIGGGSGNKVVSNLLSGCDIGIHYDARGVMDRERQGQAGANRRQRDAASKVPWTSGIYRRRYPELAARSLDEQAVPQDNLVDGNFVGKSCRPLMLKGRHTETLALKSYLELPADAPQAWAAKVDASDLQSMLSRWEQKALRRPLANAAEKKP